MKVSLNWLKDLVDVNISVEELCELFNLHSGEVEEYYKLVNATNLVVGYVESKEKHPDADKLSVCQVNIGNEVSQIVCGAPNVDKGQHVIVALPGAVLPGDFKIKKSTIRNVESNGMICSLSELGITGKKSYEDGIHVIEQVCKPGDNPLSVLHLEDEVFALDLTPNRADLLSVLGVAYDTAAILDTKVKPRDLSIEEIKEKNPVEIKIDTKLCTSYYARVIKDVVIKDSPLWMQSRLIAAGVRPINNVVDITNYVMLETGQPLHAFDYDLLGSNKILVRNAKEDERLVTLDDQERKLLNTDIVITNGEKPVALGGVMGGLDTEVTPSTKTILLESAVFDPSTIRKTSRRLDLRSESSMRFERKVDPNRTLLALNMAAKYFGLYAEGQILQGINKVELNDLSEKEIKVSVSKINKVLGSDLSDETVSSILSRLDFNHSLENGTLRINVPTRRQDIETYQDIVEEVGRIIGYDNLPTTLPDTVSLGALTDRQLMKRKIHTLLTGLGLNEVVTYSLTDKDTVLDFVSKDEHNLQEKLVHLLMPMSNDKSTMILSPIGGLVEVVKYNKARKNPDMFIYELGKRYTSEGETEVVSGALSGELSSLLWQGKKEVVDFYTVKGILESLLNELGLSHLYLEATDTYKNLHPGQTALIRDYNKVYGFIGKLHPKYEAEQDLKNVYVFELKLDVLLEGRRPLKKAKEVNKFPSMYRDLALVVDETVDAKEIIDVINKAGKRMVTNVLVFDVFKGGNLEENQKSIALRLEFTDPKRTLETKEVDDRVQEILQALESKLKATLR